MPSPSSFFFSKVLMDAAFFTYLFIVYFPHLIVSFKMAGILSSFFLSTFLSHCFLFFPPFFPSYRKISSIQKTMENR